MVTVNRTGNRLATRLMSSEALLMMHGLMSDDIV